MKEKKEKLPNKPVGDYSGFIHMVGNLYIKGNSVAWTTYDLFEFDNNATKRRPDGKMREVGYGMPLDSVIRYIIHRHSSLNSETLEEYLEMFVELEMDMIRKCKKLVHDMFEKGKELDKF